MSAVFIEGDDMPDMMFQLCEELLPLISYRIFHYARCQVSDDPQAKVDKAALDDAATLALELLTGYLTTCQTARDLRPKRARVYFELDDLL